MAALFIGGLLRKINNFIVVFFVVFTLFVQGVSEDVTDGLSVTEGDSVTLHTGVKVDQQNRINWYFNASRIAQISVNSNKTCTDVQCSKANERFRGRIKLNHQTGSLSITNISRTDDGDYKLKIFSSDSPQESVFRVKDVSAAEVKRKFVKEGESVTLDPLIKIKTTDFIKWYFNDSVVAKISGNGEEVSRNRLTLDKQTGSLIIMNITTTDSGDYHLEISGSSSKNYTVTILTTFSVNVTAVTGLSSALAMTSDLFVWLFVLLPVAAAVAASLGYYHYRFYKNDKENNKNVILDEVKGDGKSPKPDDCKVSELKNLELLIKLIGENQQQ